MRNIGKGISKVKARIKMLEDILAVGVSNNYPVDHSYIEGMKEALRILKET